MKTFDVLQDIPFENKRISGESYIVLYELNKKILIELCKCDDFSGIRGFTGGRLEVVIYEEGK